LINEYWRWQDVENMAFVMGAVQLTGSLPGRARAALQNEDTGGFARIVRAANPGLFPIRTFEEIQEEWLEGLIQELERKLEREVRKGDRKHTLGEIAKAGGVPYEFAKEAQRGGLIRPDRGRGNRIKRYRPKLASWLSKLYTMRQGGLSWEEIRDWTQRRFAAGHKHERRWPGVVDARLAELEGLELEDSEAPADLLEQVKTEDAAVQKLLDEVAAQEREAVGKLLEQVKAEDTAVQKLLDEMRQDVCPCCGRPMGDADPATIEASWREEEMLRMMRCAW